MVEAIRPLSNILHFMKESAALCAATLAPQITTLSIPLLVHPVAVGCPGAVQFLEFQRSSQASFRSICRLPFAQVLQICCYCFSIACDRGTKRLGGSSILYLVSRHPNLGCLSHYLSPHVCATQSPHDPDQVHVKL